MVDAAVQLEQHPRRHPFAVEQVAGGEDQVVVIEYRPPLLLPPIGAQQGVAQAQEPGRGLGRHRRAALHDRLEKAAGLGFQDLGGARRRGRRVLGDQARADLGLPVRQKGVGVGVEAGRPVIGAGGQPCGQDPGALRVGGGARVQGRYGQAQAEGVEGLVLARRGDHGPRRGAFGQAEEPAGGGEDFLDRAVAVDQPGEAAARPGQLSHELGEGGFVNVGGDVGQGRGQESVPGRVGPGEDLFPGRRQHFLGVPFLEDGEVGRDSGLQREAPEQGLAEGVDGLDVHAAGRVQHLGEQVARPAADVVVGLAPQMAGQRFLQRLVRRRRPLAQLLGDAVRHLGGGRPGEGEAQDMLGPGAGEHQAQHPVGEHLGLAGSGRRRHPDGGFRVGGPALGGLGVGEDDGVRRHRPSSSPEVDHSLIRARCS